MKFKTSGPLFRKIVLPHFTAPVCHPSTFMNLAKIDMSSKHSIIPLSPYGHFQRATVTRVVPLAHGISKNRHLFGETCSWDFSATSCHTSIFIDVANVFLANRRSVMTICTVSRSNSSHMDVTGPMNFEKKIGPFFAKSCSRDFATTICHPSTLWTLQKPPWLKDVP